MVETDDRKYLYEPKKSSELSSMEIQAKARAAVSWCRHATDHELTHGGKPWSYLLTPSRRHRRQLGPGGQYPLDPEALVEPPAAPALATREKGGPGPSRSGDGRAG